MFCNICIIVLIIEVADVCRCRLDRETVNAELDEVVRAVIDNYFEPEKNGLIPRKE